MGYVKHIIYKGADRTPMLPVAVMVEFENYLGPNFDERYPKLVPIIPMLSEVRVGETTYERVQVPLRLSWAITIHKSQGLTLKDTFIDIGKTEAVSGLAYVAFSRMQELDSFVVKPFSMDRLRNISKVKQYIYRIKEEERLKNLGVHTLEKFRDGVSEEILTQFLQ